MKLGVTDMEIEVRAGTVDDVALLQSFIRSMAEFEKLEVTATEDILRESLFGDRPAAHTLLAFADGGPAAYAVYSLPLRPRWKSVVFGWMTCM
jgi:hypothetical protein